jgi:DNA repair protein SbcC/Rad50
VRPVRLDLAGFAAFREPTTVDFTDADFFALVGPTGSGKSTVLDAICFALYGTVPRWNDRRAIANALAPSANEARVRLIFESGGARFAATRIVRRDGKGKVTTTHAGLEQLPPGFDLSNLDTGLDAADLGDVLAGTPAEMESAILETVGLPFEQFTSCVILPQGQFAEFLHAKPAIRQQILVNLLGLRVYEQVRDKATARQQLAEAALRASDPLVAGLADATEEALAEADAHVDAMSRLAADVELAVPRLTEAKRTAAAAHAALIALDGDLKALSTVAAPVGVTDVASAAATARTAQRDATALVVAAEEREEKVRGELAAAGDATDLRRLLDLHSERARAGERAAEAASTLAAAAAEHEASATMLAAATEAVAAARLVVAAAEDEIEAARTADRAATLRPHLVEGEPCPVCEQVVAVVPAVPDVPRLAAANATLAKAQTGMAAADKTLAARDRAVRDLDVALRAARALGSQLADRCAELDSQLADAPHQTTLRDELRVLNELQMRLDEAGTDVREAREVNRRAGAAAIRAEEKITAAWRGFDGVRDRVARFSPPPADRDDLAGAWSALTSWASSLSADLGRKRADVVASTITAADGVADAGDAIEALFEAAGIDSVHPADPARTPDHTRIATIAVEQARAAHARVAERREQWTALTAARADSEHEAQVARALAQHLRANNFERWLLAEALDSLVDGASTILRELSGGQYDLGHDKGEFYVVDHHDAALRRGVRTLSGGETFQASLALALALADQLAGLSTSAASLESIMLDEGFGTLDAATLDMVAATLENLAARGDRMVGVVTHVAALAERIAVRFDVHKDARTAYIERVG